MIQFEITQRISISANISIFRVIKKTCTVQICLAALALQRYIYVTKPAHIFISLETKHLYTPPFLSSRSPHPKAPPPSAWFCHRSLPVKREHFLPTVVKLLLKRDHLIVPHKINHLEEMLV